MSTRESLTALEFTVSGFISRPPEVVYEGVASPDILSSYFTTGGAVGRLEAGATVTWDFADFPGEFPVEVIEAVAPSALSCAGQAIQNRFLSGPT